MRSGRARISLVDQHALFTDCLASTLERRGYDTRIVFIPPPPMVFSVRQAAREVWLFEPRVVILTGDLGPNGQSETLLALLSASGIPVVVLSKELDESQWGAYLARGARVVIPMTASLPSVCEVVRHLADGVPVMSRAERGRLLGAYRPPTGARLEEQERLATLSPNEVEILMLLLAGCTPAEMARSRVVSISTVRTQVKWILSKLEVRSQIAAVATAHRAGWVADS